MANLYRLEVNNVEISYCHGTARRVAEILAVWTNTKLPTTGKITITTLRELADIYADQCGVSADIVHYGYTDGLIFNQSQITVE